MATKAKREIIEPVPKAREVAYTVPLPGHVDQVCLESQLHLDGDLRNAIAGQLGCTFSMLNGLLTAQDGRKFDVTVNGRALELV